MPKIFEGHGDNRKRVVVSLCDYSGNWPKPYHDAGHTVLCYDLKHGDDVTKLTPSAVGFDIHNALHPRSEQGGQIVLVLAAPPCTDFTVSGARWWPAKDADGRTEQSLTVLDACIRLALALSPDCWAMENPVGRLPKLRPGLGKPTVYFHPHEYCRFAGVNDDDPRVQAERYTKKTGLWGEFTMPDKAGLEPIMYERGGKRGSWMWANLGGKSERTKELRSMTPMGFARAFYAANMR